MERILRMKELSVVISMSRSSCYEKMNPRSKRYDPSFPRPIQIGVRAVGWRESELMAWLLRKSGVLK